MDTKVKFLKQLALKVTSATSEDEVAGETVCEVLDYIVKNYKEGAGSQGPAGPQGEKGEKGIQVNKVQKVTKEILEQQVKMEKV